MNTDSLILVINAGSSSIKFSCYQLAGKTIGPLRCLNGELTNFGQGAKLVFAVGEHGNISYVERIVSAVTPAEGFRQIITVVIDDLARSHLNQGSSTIAAVGHRMVHGGETFAGPVILTPAIHRELEALVPLAPLHMPHNLAALDVVTSQLPGAVQIACFDTAFHQTCPAAARRFAIPREYHNAGLKRFGFHGLSYEYVSRRLGSLMKQQPHRVVLAHLGSGASLCGLLDGRSMTTTMGYTPLDGLVMATRCGSLDPGVVLALATRFGHSVSEVDEILSKRSGLLGVSGLSGDMRTLLDSSDPRSAEAVDLFCRSIVRETAAAVAELGGLDALVFTGGIGTHCPDIRQRVCSRLEWLGVSMDKNINQKNEPEQRLDDGSGPAVWTIRTDEQLVIVEHVCSLMRQW